jgi:hypothetical protein
MVWIFRFPAIPVERFGFEALLKFSHFLCNLRRRLSLFNLQGLRCRIIGHAEIIN